MKSIDLTNVQEAGEYQRHPAGPYICKIINVEDLPEKEYLKVTFDIADGEYKDYYKKGREEHSDWAWYGAYTKSYKTTALPMFKRFCSAVSKSNGSFVFDGGASNSDEKTLIGKKIGLTFREVEYYGNDGNLKTKLEVFSEFPIDKIGEQKIPNIKKLKEDAPKPAADDGFLSGDDTDVPFL